MHKQLLLLHNAVSAYFSGNQQALEATMKQFSIKVKAPNSNEPSWIEQWKVYIYDFIKKKHLNYCLQKVCMVHIIEMLFSQTKIRWRFNFFFKQFMFVWKIILQV